jgi:TatA/E family protein of Tat protein translocase
MFNLDPAKLLVIGVVAIILLGPDRLPQVARQVGGAWRSFNDYRRRMEAEVRSNIPDLPSTENLARLLNHLGSMTSGEQVESPATETDVAVRPIESFGLPVHRGEMSWVTADYTSEAEAPTVEPANHPPRPIIGDANLN